MSITLYMTRPINGGATVQLTPVAWQHIAARLPLVMPTTALSVRVQLASRITDAISTSDAPALRITLTAAELALVRAAAEGVSDE